MFSAHKKNVPSLAFELLVKCIVSDLNPGLKWHEFWTIYVNFTWWGGKNKPKLFVFHLLVKGPTVCSVALNKKYNMGFEFSAKACQS